MPDDGVRPLGRSDLMRFPLLWRSVSCLSLACGLWPIPDASAQIPVAGAASAGAGFQLVIPFENLTREPRVYWLSEGSSVLLAENLRALGVPVFTRDERLHAFDRLRVPPVATLSHATIIRLGQIIGAARVVLGGFELQGDELTVHGRAIRLDTGQMFPEVVERGPLNDVFGIYARIAVRLVPESKVSLEQMKNAYPPLPAFEQFVKGLVAENPATRVSFLTQALRLAPGFQQARLELWAAYTDQSEHQRALDVVKQGPPGDPLARRARFLAAVSTLQLGRYQESFEAFNELNKAKTDPALLNNLGIVQLRRVAPSTGGKPVFYFNEAAKADPSDSDLFFNVGYAYWLDRDPAGAIYWLREAVRRNPADDEAHYVLGVALQASGTAVEAAREKELARRLSSVYAEWEAKQPGGNPVPRGLERLKMDLDLPSSIRVENILVEAEQRDQRELAIFYLERGRRLFQAERDSEAIGELRRAIYLAPYQSEAHLLLGRIYLRSGRAQEAIEVLKISIWSEDTPSAHLALAEAYIQTKDETSARTELQGLITRDPNNVAARRLLDGLQ
jgi:tetratricopeptide (TPR) repeat protein